MSLLSALLLVGFAAGQYSIWQTTSVYAGANCSSRLVLQTGVPVAVTSCAPQSCGLGSVSDGGGGGGNSTVASENATMTSSAAVALQGQWWTQSSCDSFFLPETQLAYRFYLSTAGDGTCAMRGLPFRFGVGVRSGCQALSSVGGTVGAVRADCYRNASIVWGFDDAACMVGQRALLSLPIAVQFVNWPQCYRDTTDNQTFWLATCPFISSW